MVSQVLPDNLFTRFAAAADPDKPLLRFLDDPPLCYGEVFAAAARFAHVLIAHGVKPGDRVAVQAEKSAASLILYLACLRAGAVYLPLNTGYTPAELAYFVKDAEPRLFVVAEKNLEKIQAALPQLEFLTLGDDGRSGSLIREAKAQSGDFPDADVGMGDLASILYTSGTTGRSKAPCSVMEIFIPMPKACARLGNSPTPTSCCTPCRFFTFTACSSPPM